MPPNSPFLTVVTRTRGSRLPTLRDTLMSLAGQTCQDFEQVIVVHSGSDAAESGVRALVGEFPSGLRERIGVIRCTRRGRAAPLNDGVAHAGGRYIAVLDDDDMVLAHWVETFQRLAERKPGQLLRATVARQEFVMAPAGDRPPRPRAQSWFSMPWPASYDAIHHVRDNATPFMSLAFPAEVFRDDRLRFDESLTTAEDWQLTTRAAMLHGVAGTPEVTSIYRWWVDGESSLFDHPPEEWTRNRLRAQRHFDLRPLRLPAGSASRIIALLDGNDALAARVAELEAESGRLSERNRELSARIDQLAAEGAQLDEQNRQLAADNGDLGAQIVQLSESNRRLDELNAQLGDHNSQLQAQAGQLGDDNRRLGDLNSRQSADILRIRESNRRLRDDNSQLDGQNRSLNARIDRLNDLGDRLEDRVRRLIENQRSMAAPLISAGQSPPGIEEDPVLDELSRQTLVDLLSSRCWRWTRPLRRLRRVFGGREPEGLSVDRIPQSLAERQRLIRDVRASASWRMTLPLRAAGRLLRTKSSRPYRDQATGASTLTRSTGE